ncbi:MAG: electron transfer flavoprotein subunit beta/FixA family protein [candidate division WOR-3 bacterium]
MFNIIVCVKQVPSTETRFKIDSQTSLVDLKEIEWVINPYDEYALEEALRIKEKYGGKVKVISVGEERVKTTLKTALAMGVDEVFHIKTNERVLESQTSAYLTYQFIVKQNLSFDLILCGIKGIDYDQGVFPISLATLLKIPFITTAIKIELDNEDKKIKVSSELENGTEISEALLPCLITCQKGLNEPRYPSLRLMMQASKKPIPTIEIEKDIPSLPKFNFQINKMFLPPPRKAGKILEGEVQEVVKELIRLLREEAKVL